MACPVDDLLSQGIEKSDERNRVTWGFFPPSLFAVFPPVLLRTFEATAVQEKHAIPRGNDNRSTTVCLLD